MTQKLKTTNGEIAKIWLKFMLQFGWLIDVDHDL